MAVNSNARKPRNTEHGRRPSPTITPHTAKALDTLAEGYEWEARRQDENAERLHWEL